MHNSGSGERKDCLILHFNKILNILYPKKCPICEKIIDKGGRPFCIKCEKTLIRIKEPVCIICGRPVKITEVKCRDCENNPHEFDGGRITFSYEQISDAVYRFKYMNRPEYSDSFARIIYEEQKDWLDVISPDCLIPVPLHKKRLIKRGYNQSEELALAISKYCKVPVNTSLVKRVKNTAPLKFHDREGRQNNMKRAFIVCENVVKLTTVVLVDDIVTTGSTLDSIAHVLRAAGVSNIYFLTITGSGT